MFLIRLVAGYAHQSTFDRDPPELPGSSRLRGNTRDVSRPWAYAAEASTGQPADEPLAVPKEER
jgi:hypothetical protein